MTSRGPFLPKAFCDSMITQILSSMFSLLLFIRSKLSYIFVVQKVLVFSVGTLSSAFGTFKN